MLLNNPLSLIKSTNLLYTLSLSIPDSKTIVLSIRVDKLATFRELNTRNISSMSIENLLLNGHRALKIIDLNQLIIRASHEVIIKGMKVNPVNSLQMSLTNYIRLHF